MTKRLLGSALVWLALAGCIGPDSSREGATARADAISSAVGEGAHRPG